MFGVGLKHKNKVLYSILFRKWRSFFWLIQTKIKTIAHTQHVDMDFQCSKFKSGKKPERHNTNDTTLFIVHCIIIIIIYYGYYVSCALKLNTEQIIYYGSVQGLLVRFFPLFCFSFFLDSFKKLINNLRIHAQITFRMIEKCNHSNRKNNEY